MARPWTRMLALLALAGGCAPDPERANTGSPPPSATSVPSARSEKQSCGPSGGSCQEVCRLFGLCRCDTGTLLSENECEAASDEDCRRSEICRTEGRCMRWNARCAVATQAICTLEPCTLDGRCDLANGRCVASSDERCLASETCKRSGACRAEGGACVVDRAGCERAPGCKEWGACSPSSGACKAVTDADCAGSASCKLQGRCKPRDGQCEVR